MRKKNTIEINGRRYDTETGALLDHAAAHQPPVRPAGKPTAPKPVIHQTARPARQHRPAARWQPRRAPAASQTLMRRAVRRPAPRLKYRLRAQGHTDVLAEQYQPATEFKYSFQVVNDNRLKRASRINRSQRIRHFSPLPLGQVPVVTARAITPVPPPTAVHTAATKAASTAHSANHARPVDRLLAQALKQADSYQELPPAKRHVFRRRRHTKAHA